MPSILNRRGRPPHPDIITPADWQVLRASALAGPARRPRPSSAAPFHTLNYRISNMLGTSLEDRPQLALCCLGRIERDGLGVAKG